MRIAFVTETFYPSTDGVVTRLTATIKMLTQLGHEVLVIAPEQGVTEYGGAAVRGMRAVRFFLYPDFKLSYPQRAVGRELSAFQPDIVHVVNPAMLGVAGIWYGKRWPLVASYHTNVPDYADYYRLPWLKPVLWAYLRLLHNQADLNLCTSRAVMDALQQQNIRNVQLWKRGVDTERFRPRAPSVEMRNRLSNGESDKPLLLYVGRLAVEKEIERLRTVCQAAGGTVRLAIIGDGPHRRALEDYFKDTDTVFTGFLHGEALAAAYASSDLFVFPSTTETLGLVLLEAMACGLPCVAADRGPIREQIEHGVNGYLYDPLDPADLARVALDALADRGRLEQVGRDAAATAATYGWGEPSRQLVDYYISIIQRHTAPVRSSKRRRIREGDV